MLHIENCASLELLPDNISSCRALIIIKCPSLKMMTSLEDCSTSLELLTMRSWSKASGEFDLHKLTSLESFHLDSFDFVESAESENPIKGLPKPHLSSTFTPLELSKACGVAYEDQLYNLRSLTIDYCPLLKKRCLRNEGDYWPIIADIPKAGRYNADADKSLVNDSGGGKVVHSL
ncbi:putative disease resistance RPP13-like protein 1 [Forsythia ovata]|uniref:Disease resistance RPP13-like protein 1 n=1 Tax=Forsythia ovata TaxID=205694 RepID=A0ABD1TP03_9LAMI